MCGPVLGASQSNALKTPFQTLVWLVPGVALWSLCPPQYNIEQLTKNGLLGCCPQDLLTCMSSSSCGHIDISFKWEPNPRPTTVFQHETPVQIFTFCSFSIGYFWMLLPSAGCSPPPSNPTGCPSFHLHITTSRTLTSGESRPPSINGNFPYGFNGDRFPPQDLLYHATRVIQMPFALSSCNRYCYLFAFCVKKELLSVSLQQVAATKLFGLKKKKL